MPKPGSALPERPHPDALRKRAKTLLRAATSGDREARSRLSAFFEDGRRPSLSDAQLVIAREYGFASWRALIAHVAAARSLAGRLIASIRRGDTAAVEALVDEDPSLVHASVARHDERLASAAWGPRPLHLCVAEDRVDAARLLIDRGASLDARNADGRTALHDALELGRSRLSHLLIERGATVDACCTALLGDANRLRAILGADPDAAHDMTTGLSVLGWASYGGHPDIVDVLVDAGVNLDAMDGLACAAQCDHARFVRRVLDHGVDPNKTFEDRRVTALHYAAMMPYTEHATATVSVLLRAGADPTLRDRDGKTPLDHAIEGAADPARRAKDYASVVELLEPVTR